ncbi:ATP-grasp domain-containing protein [Exiguobacterium antarcticum]|uniref:ATP-grasp domain-containing protein n=1 Tax=Exiguobacterium antarcticum TaxID=132920 RepID=A0ABT6R4F3_9BACL|nr:ATP-grasp domain-containing protein [Exiguobacterium antarcticum]MDI3235839.1 ATP-grasp domain-containing protein [Exiguobacterium antarcticum]
MQGPHLLITSAGRRAKLVEYFVNEFKTGRVSTADCNPLAPALYMTDQHYIVPRIDEVDYIDHLLQLCQAEGVTAIMSLIDPELGLLAQAAERFEALGVTVVVSPSEACQLCFDKYTMYEYCLGQGIAHARTYKALEPFREALSLGEVHLPVFVKPRSGSASIEVRQVETFEEVEQLFLKNTDLIVQELLVGQELGVDAYVDLISGQVTSIFIKEKVTMRAGETDKSRSVVREDVFEWIEHVLENSGLVGPLDFDLFDVAGTLYLSEINPRFGGGYPHAYACGVNFPAQLFRNLLHQANLPQIGQYAGDLYMLKHDTVTLISAAELQHIKW